jgi:hypothetical protein
MLAYIQCDVTDGAWTMDHAKQTRSTKKTSAEFLMGEGVLASQISIDAFVIGAGRISQIHKPNN